MNIRRSKKIWSLLEHLCEAKHFLQGMYKGSVIVQNNEQHAIL